MVHDLVVDETARGAGLGTALLEEAARWLAARGMPQIILGTAQSNTAAQRLFARLGFRRTMIEMTRST
jgi:ribosomal protein S18 acetylase RimI-like enzyme